MPDNKKMRGLAPPALVCSLTMLAISCIFMTQAIFLELSQSFGIEETRARLAFSVTSICYGLSFLITGPIADKFNQPKMAATGATVLGGAVIAASFAGSFNYFLLAMAFIGMGASAIPSTMMPYMVRSAPPEKMGVSLGVIIASATIGVVVGRFSMGLMASLVGWEWAFRIMGGLVIGAGLAVGLSLPGGEPVASIRDGGLINNFTSPFRLLLIPKMTVLLSVGFLLFFGFMGMTAFLTYRLADAPFYYSAREIGWVSLAGLTALLGAPVSGALSQKIGWFKVAFLGLCMCLVAVQIMGWIAGMAPVIIGVLLSFLGAYACQPSVFLELSRSAPEDGMGFSSSMYILFSVAGGSASATFLGPVWTNWGWPGVTLACTASLAAAAVAASLAKRL